MKRNKTAGRKEDPDRNATPVEKSCRNNTRWHPRRVVFLLFVVLLTAAFFVPLVEMVRYAIHEELHSHIVLIPFVTLYLIRSRRDKLPLELRGSPGIAMIPLLLGIGGLVLSGNSWGRD
jgi:hypothetical protein